jgi:hypothetical protein
MTSKIFSVEVAKRLFREESMDLALCHPNMIRGASDAFEAEGDHAAACDIVARYDEYQEELEIMMADARAEFGI